MKLRLINRIAAFLSLLGIVVLCTFLYMLAGTTRGSHWLLQYIDNLSDTWDVSAQHISGSLLYGLTLDKLSFNSPEKISVTIDTLHIKWDPETLLGGVINVSPLEAKGIEINIAAQSKASENAPARDGLKDLQLPLIIATGNVLLQDIAIKTGDSEFHLSVIKLEEGSLGRALKVQQLHLSAESYSFAISKGEVSTAHPFESDLDIAWQFTPPNNIPIEGRGTLTGNLETLNIKHTLTAPVNVESHGIWRPGLLTRQPPYLTVQNTISGGRWAYGQDRIIRVPSATVELQGWIDEYSLQVNGLFNVPDFPELRLELAGSGNLENLQINDLTVHGLDGTLNATGQFSWQPAISWDLQLQASHIDPGVYWKDWTGKIAMQGSTKGEYASNVLNTNLRVDSLSGTLRDYPLQASGNLGLNNGHWSSEGLELALGKNKITLSGSMGDTIAAQWDARLPNLTALLPELSGQLVGQGTLEGTISHLNFTGKLRAEKLKYQNYSIDLLNLSSTSSSERNPSSKNLNHSVLIEARDISIDDFVINNLQSNINGNIDSHNILTTLSTQFGTLDLQISGHWQEPQWQATLHKATIRDTVTGTWLLRSPSSLSVSPDTRSLTRTCWQQNRAEACVSSRFNGSEMNVEADLNAIPLELAKPWLPVNMEINGLLSGQLQAAGPLAEPTGTLLLQLEDGYFLVRQIDDDPESYAWRNARLRIDFAGGSYHMTAGLQLPKQGEASASIKLNAQKQLDGTINLHFTQLAWLEAWTPPLRDIQGALDAELNLTGTLEHPQWLGTARLDEAAMSIPSLGVDLRGLTATFKGGGKNQVSIEGSAESGPGQVRIDGQLDKAPAQPWQLSLNVTGNRLEVVNTPEARALVTPDLVVSASKKLIYIKGTIKLPEVDIQLQDLPDKAVKVSEDVVIVNEPEADIEQTNGIPIKTNIKLILGDRVHFKGFGFEAQLSGSLELIEEPRQPTLAYGTLTIDEGRYKAYGQNLLVEQGKLIFQGPYDNPGLNIRATRKAQDVTVGLDIGGTLKNIRSTVFSEPALPDSEAVAILLTGKRLSDTSKSEANVLVNAIASLGIKKSKPLTSQLSETLGLDVLTIESESGLEQSSLTIGKYLTPRLYVRYAIGLFDQLTKLALEYRLTEHIMVEAKSGKDQSMDIIYRIER